MNEALDADETKSGNPDVNDVHIPRPLGRPVKSLLDAFLQEQALDESEHAIVAAYEAPEEAHLP